MSHTCHVRYVYTWRYDGRHVHILTIVIWGGVPVGSMVHSRLGSGLRKVERAGLRR